MTVPAFFSRHMFALALAFLAMTSAAAAAPDEELLGKSQGYPLGTREGWFFDERTRIGSFSNLDRIMPHYTIGKPFVAYQLTRAATEPRIEYWFQDRSLTIDDFLARQRITGLLLVKDGEILVERYQYGRNAAHRFVSHSMAKSIVSIAVGIALAEGKIDSLDNEVAKYEPKLAGTLYGETSIRNLLRMSSGVKFNEVYDGKDDMSRFSTERFTRTNIGALKELNVRDAEPGARFHYASSETVALAVLLRAVTGVPLTDYLAKRLWEPMGAEAEATWVKTPDGLVSGAGSFNAILRDYGRLGIMLANDGMIGGRQIVSKDYLLDATDVGRQPDAFAPRKATPYFGYGYQFWLFPGAQRRFALLGVYGQAVMVDPELKLVMVVTAAAKNAEIGKESLGPERDALWRGFVQHYGRW